MRLDGDVFESERRPRGRERFRKGLREGSKEVQEWLSFYFKSPMAPEGLYPEHDLFIQLTKLKNTLRYLMGEGQITHLGEYVLEHERSPSVQLVSE